MFSIISDGLAIDLFQFGGRALSTGKQAGPNTIGPDRLLCPLNSTVAARYVGVVSP